MKRSTIVGMAIFVVFAGISAGILVHMFRDQMLEKEMLARINTINDKTREQNTPMVQTASSEDKISPNSKFIFKTYYLKCGHMKVETLTAEIDDINKTKEEMQKKYSNWLIKDFSANEVELYKEVNGKCEHHYIIKEKDGKIAIYNFDENDNEVLKEETEISTKYLPKEDIELLRSGINADSDQKLKQILSDYE